MSLSISDFRINIQIGLMKLSMRPESWSRKIILCASIDCKKKSANEKTCHAHALGTSFCFADAPLFCVGAHEFCFFLQQEVFQDVLLMTAAEFSHVLFSVCQQEVFQDIFFSSRLLPCSLFCFEFHDLFLIAP